MQVADGMSEAEAGYERRLTAAKLQSRSIEEVEQTHNRNMLKEVKRRMQASIFTNIGSVELHVNECMPPKLEGFKDPPPSP